ncbi:AraC family transcriptional regulator [Myroides pelagicus]|uniref:Helix-turn-helix domain-containing protein n=1 Tax=Myroides pelagicus TaxID=270914 RepID=A0A7K1GMF2_9FLAO|nr:GyrI-like domain-containing protein [Myroides pelagicus]MEC4113526.1 GyrI-like domain-containing protein [Myroides pelagicus]MTH30082.1 helix-turn-helix domain-containing protein [Myroides pelagicus]
MQKRSSYNRYIKMVNDVVDYINQHYTDELSLALISNHIGVSSFHFHRLFSQIAGISLNRFITLVRLTKAATLLKNNREMTITEIAYSSGFSSLSLFSRVFVKHYAMTPTDFQQKQQGVEQEELAKVDYLIAEYSKNVQNKTLNFMEVCKIIIKNFTIMEFKIEERVLDTLTVAYVRHIGDYREIGKSYEKLFEWAFPRGVMSQSSYKVLTAYHDDPAIVGLEGLRQDVCISIPMDMKVEEPLGKVVLEGGKYVVGRFEIKIEEFAQAWETMCLYIVQNDCKLRLAKSYEFHLNNFKEHPEQKIIAELCLPIE